MKFFSLLLFLSFSLIHCSFSQKTEKLPLEIPSDTLEGETTDTSIVYIIKRAPVTIKEKVEVQREKKKQYLYISWGFHGFVYSEKRKASSGNEAYLSKLKPLLSSKPSYAIELKIWQAPKNIITGLSLIARRFNENFNYTTSNGELLKITNNYNYGAISFYLGKWFRKNKKTSYQVYGGLSGDYFVSAKGFVLDKSNQTEAARINRTVFFSKMTGSISTHFSILYTLKNSYLEIGPSINISPFSTTTKKEFYSLSRYSIGIRIAYTNKLF